MKPVLLAFICFILIGFGYFSIQFLKNRSSVSSPVVTDESYVHIKEKQFYLKGQHFTVVAINFIVSLRVTDSAMWPSVYVGYVPEEKYYQTSRDSCLKVLKDNFQLLKDKGFNTVRVTSIAEAQIMNPVTGWYRFRGNYQDNYDYTLELETDEQYRKYFSAVQDLLDILEATGLKAILTVKMFPESPGIEVFLKKLTARFKENTNIIAYDLFNEPLYFDEKLRVKEDVYKITKRWHNIVKTNAPHHLTTLGLASQRELFEWDPNIVVADFISFHPYEYEPDQVRNELYWYHKYVNKPWIIGETGIPSNNDSIPYQNQVKFAEKTMIQALNCGGAGYSWWQYKDVEWGKYHQNYLGVMNRSGNTLNSNGQPVHGTPKPVMDFIGGFDWNKKKEECFCPPNYYNFSGNTQFKIIGKLQDKEGRSLEGAGVIAWDQDYINHYFTVTRQDGSFALYSDYAFYHWMVSATYHERIIEHVSFDSAYTDNGIPTINIGTIQLKKSDIPEN